MIHVSQPMTTVPEHFSTPLQELVYRTLTRLSIPFQRPVIRHYTFGVRVLFPFGSHQSPPMSGQG